MTISRHHIVYCSVLFLGLWAFRAWENWQRDPPPIHHEDTFKQRDPDNDGSTLASSPSCAPISIPVNQYARGARQQALLFRRDDIPDVNTQPQSGSAIQALTAFDGRLHLAYGDSSDNTGPISMHAWDPLLRMWIYTGLLATEEVRHFRTHGDDNDDGNHVLYTPEIDAHGEERRSRCVVYQMTCESGRENATATHSATWSVMGNPLVGAAHIYDLAVLPDSTLLVSTGSRHGGAAVLASTRDRGQTWNDVYRVPTSPEAYSRIYYMGVTDELLYIWGRLLQRDADETFAMVWWHGKTNDRHEYTRPSTDATFQPIANLDTATPPDHPDDPPCIVPIVLGDDMILVAFGRRPPAGPHVGTYRVRRDDDGTTSTLVSVTEPWPGIHDDSDDDSDDTELVAWTTTTTTDHTPRLLVLLRCCDGVAAVVGIDSLDPPPVPVVHDDGDTWRETVILDPLPDRDDAYISLALLRNDLYLGTRQGNLYIVREFFKSL